MTDQQQEETNDHGSAGMWARSQARRQLIKNALAQWLVDDVIELICEWCQVEVVVAVHEHKGKIKVGYFDAVAKRWIQEGCRPMVKERDGERGQLFGGMINDFTLVVSDGLTWDEQKRPLAYAFNFKTHTWQPKPLVGVNSCRWVRTHWHSMQGDDRRVSWAISSTRLPGMHESLESVYTEEEELEIEHVAIHKWEPVVADWVRVGRASDVGLYWMAVEHRGVVYCIEAAHGKNPDMDDEIALARFDVKAGTWLQSRSPLVPTARRHTGVAALDGGVFVLGGRTMYTDIVSKTAERYDVSTNVWHKCKDMHDAKVSPLAVAVEGRLFVLGQHIDHWVSSQSPDGYNKLAEWYCPRTDTWEIAYQLRKPPRNAFLTVACV